MDLSCARLVEEETRPSALVKCIPPFLQKKELFGLHLPLMIYTCPTLVLEKKLLCARCWSQRSYGGREFSVFSCPGWCLFFSFCRRSSPICVCSCDAPSSRSMGEQTHLLPVQERKTPCLLGNKQSSGWTVIPKTELEHRCSIHLRDIYGVIQFLYIRTFVTELAKIGIVPFSSDGYIFIRTP